MEGRVVVVADPDHGTQVIADHERHSGTQGVEHRLAARRQRAGLDGIGLDRRLLDARGEVLVRRVTYVTVVPAFHQLTSACSLASRLPAHASSLAVAGMLGFMRLIASRNLWASNVCL